MSLKFGAKNKIYENDMVIAFNHPYPSYHFHVVIIPVEEIRDLISIDLAQPSMMIEIMRCVQWIITEYDLDKRGYRLIVNGGQYQEIPVLHYHLVSGEPKESRD